jgi:hypothetical protein
MDLIMTRQETAIDGLNCHPSDYKDLQLQQIYCTVVFTTSTSSCALKHSQNGEE